MLLIGHFKTAIRFFVSQISVARKHDTHFLYSGIAAPTRGRHYTDRYNGDNTMMAEKDHDVLSQSTGEVVKLRCEI